MVSVFNDKQMTIFAYNIDLSDGAFACTCWCGHSNAGVWDVLGNNLKRKITMPKIAILRDEKKK